MDATADELAGVVDLFGGLTREELERALGEAAYRDDGKALDEDAFEAALEAALATFALVKYEPAGADGDGEALYVPGPTAFPATPESAEDLPHILDLEARSIDRDALAESTHEHFREAVDAALEAGDDDRTRDLLETSYDLETWAPVDAAAERERLDAAIE